MKLASRIALACGLLPMLTGTAVMAAWLVSGHDALESAGIVIIYGGIALVATGLVALAAFVFRARERGIAYMKPALAALAILLLNFPLCAAYVAFAAALEFADIVTVVNRAAEPIEQLVLTDALDRLTGIGTVRPGEIRHACPDFNGEGSVTYTFHAGGRANIGVLIGYHSGLNGGYTTLDLSEELDATAHEGFGRISLSDYIRHCVLG